jgi:hypothetical protein
VDIHPSSVNSQFGTQFPFPWLVYCEKVKTSGVYIRDSTCVPAYAILLLGGALEETPASGGEIKILGGNYSFNAPPHVLDLIRQLRLGLDQLLAAKVNQPGLDVTAEGGRIVDAVCALIAEEEAASHSSGGGGDGSGSGGGNDYSNSNRSSNNYSDRGGGDRGGRSDHYGNNNGGGGYRGGRYGGDSGFDGGGGFNDGRGGIGRGRGGDFHGGGSRGGVGGGGEREGDWACPQGCGMVFASKNQCFRCGAPQPTGGFSLDGGRQLSATQPISGGGSGGGLPAPRGRGFPPPRY